MLFPTRLAQLSWWVLKGKRAPSLFSSCSLFLILPGTPSKHHTVE
jgi:hypothetical protein